MASENFIKQTITVFTEIQRKLVNPTFKFSQGGATTKTLSKFLDLFAKEFGGITKERLVDFCVCASYIFKNRENEWTIKQVFGSASIKRLKEISRGQRYHEDLWLSSSQLSRGHLINLIIDRSEHPQAKYIYVHSEEGSKKRLLNQEVGYLLCQASTLGWSPVSEACGQCNFVDQCKKETERKYPELYRIRVEYGESNQ